MGSIDLFALFLLDTVGQEKLKYVCSAKQMALGLLQTIEARH